MNAVQLLSKLKPLSKKLLVIMKCLQVHTHSHTNTILQVERGNGESEAKLFSVPDFIGFACREVGKHCHCTCTCAEVLATCS